MTTSMSNAARKGTEKGVSPLSPYLTCTGAAEAIAFYKAAFGAEELICIPGQDGRIMHACLSINGASVMLGDEFPEMGAVGPNTLGGTPVSMHLVVDDVDAGMARAEKAGATVVMPADDQFWGDRFGMVKDPYGHMWSFATPIREMTREELMEAAKSAQCG